MKVFFQDQELYKKIKTELYEKDFEGWISEKIVIENKKKYNKNKYVNERDIWDCKIGINIGRESNGKGKYMRPVLVLKKIGDLFLIVPLSKFGKKEDDKNGKYYFELKGYFEDSNIESYVLLSQIRTVDKKRLVKHMETINDDDYNIIVEKIKELYF